MSSQKSSLKRPAFKIATKKSKIGIRLKPIPPSQAIATKEITIHSNINSSSSSYCKLPSILTKKYDNSSYFTHKSNCSKSNNTQPIQQNEKINDDEDSSINQIFVKLIDQTEHLHEIELALQALTNRHAAAVCQLINDQSCYITFVLKPMIKYALHSTTSTSSSNNETVQVMSSYISTEINADLDKLNAENKIRLIQLHGMTDDQSDDDENIAILLFNDYIRAVHDAASVQLHNAASEKDNDDEELSSSYHEIQCIINLFVDCLYHHGFNGRYISIDKLTNSLELAWMQQKKCMPSSSSSKTEGDEKRTIESNFIQQYKLQCQPEKWIKFLVQIQLLLPRSLHTSQTSCTSSYWYTLPKMGLAAKLISEGRKKMINYIERSYQKEIKRNKLEQMNLGKSKASNSKRFFSSMTGAFHIMDLLARDIVKVVHQPSGDFIKLKK